MWSAKVFLVVIALAACSGTAPDVSPTPSPAPSVTAATDPTATPVTEIVVGGERPVTVRVPPGAGATPAPLLLVLHGFGSSGDEMARFAAIHADATARGIVIAYPDGTRDTKGTRFWNATDACCNLYGSEVDDVAYLAGLIEEIGRATSIDPKRVYLAGHSNGGFMAYRMACDRAPAIAAIVSLAGATQDDPADCAPSEPVAVLEIHGTEDVAIRFDGYDGTDPRRAYPGAEAGVLAWAVYDGCRAELETLPELLDLDRLIDGPNGPAESTIQAAPDCAAGGAAELWTIPGGSHVPNLSSSFVTEVLDFLLAHSKP